MEIVDTNLIGAMSPPGGGRNTISTRFMRHFNIQGLVEPDMKNLHRIYSSIMNNYANMHFDKPDILFEVR